MAARSSSAITGAGVPLAACSTSLKLTMKAEMARWEPVVKRLETKLN